VIEEKTRPNKMQHQHKNAKLPNNKTKKRDHTIVKCNTVSTLIHFHICDNKQYSSLSRQPPADLQMSTQSTLPHPTDIPQQLADHRGTTIVIPIHTRDLQPHHPSHQNTHLTYRLHPQRHHSLGVTIYNAVKPTSYPSAYRVYM
jgi:hypothetical protein